MTDQEFERWLESPSERRVMLIEMDHGGGTVQIADQPYLAPMGDDLADPTYLDVLSEAVGISTRVDGLIEYGDLTLIDDGSITPWLHYAWRGWPVRILLGDMRWSRHDFRPLAVATNQGVQSGRAGRIVMRISDSSALLDDPIDTGSLPDDAGPVPLVLGRVFNAPTYRVSTQTLRYAVSYLPLQSLYARDIGNIVPRTAHLADGEMTLDNAPGNQSDITAAPIESHDTPLEIVQWVAARYGREVAPTTSLPSVRVGLQSSNEISGAQILDALADTLGAGWMIDALDRIDMRVLTAPTGAAEITLEPDDVQDATLQLDEIVPPWASLTLRWGRNYAPLNNVAAIVDQNDPALAARLRQEWRETSRSQSLPDYPLAEAVTLDTLMQDAGEVATECERRLAYHSVPREHWRVTTYRPTVALYQSIIVNVGTVAGRLGRVTAVRQLAGGKAEVEFVL
ncbi:hypothetical protein QO259_17055 [Salinicola sp. JS01]|uniref:hypothetical protein n=1 Tax=Salinicola sp. JS01 TaxID=3050071 RepID=UPI00255C0A0A|nr:hypothetical protein [Salinicola sp. JS01]WIX32497.1 hypothetical protein QO259_17055 [Salinicola sp. JS01]